MIYAKSARSRCLVRLTWRCPQRWIRLFSQYSSRSLGFRITKVNDFWLLDVSIKEEEKL